MGARCVRIIFIAHHPFLCSLAHLKKVDRTCTIIIADAHGLYIFRSVTKKKRTSSSQGPVTNTRTAILDQYCES